ncbi:MAG: carbohydrate ABC transporter permease [Candidatus Gastranaerophilales bacterium]|nr:carbohydrate ABC transporter permease [Candidatus Gastranaerophilales bacterium]
MFKKVFMHTILILAAVSMLAPFAVMLIISLSSENSISYSDLDGFIKHLTLNNYRNVCDTIPVFRYFCNSLIVSVFTTVGQIAVSTVAGYAFARINFKYGNVLFFIILVTMFIPPQVNIIPLFFLMRKFHLADSYPALILPGIFGGFGVFLMRQHFLSFPKELEDASIIDGCSRFQMFIKIVCPLALPAMAALGIFTFITSWNAFIWPLIITNSESMRTLPLGLAIFKGSYREIIEWGDLLACSIICTVPAVLIFLAGKNFIINDLMKGGVKE